MLGKSLILFLVVVFLTFLIAPECSFAEMFVGDIDPAPDSGAVIAVTVGLVVIVVVGVVLLVKHGSKKPEQRQDEQQKPTDPISSEIKDEPFTSPSGQIALLRW